MTLRERESLYIQCFITERSEDGLLNELITGQSIEVSRRITCLAVTARCILR